ncbi:hypothetical protein Cgig2_020500 [Carnegiea gigantea]|uniref:Uncharacterized protein n=1 Tax=Carnegiea gigantea TaxID=171969 RepID=A0A9Q1KBV4_9CARY|nr:hypothetical protein Cgig2_020500 [Carnegiea gigantea]
MKSAENTLECIAPPQPAYFLPEALPDGSSSTHCPWLLTAAAAAAAAAAVCQSILVDILIEADDLLLEFLISILYRSHQIKENEIKEGPNEEASGFKNADEDCFGMKVLDDVKWSDIGTTASEHSVRLLHRSGALGVARLLQPCNGLVAPLMIKEAKLTHRLSNNEQGLQCGGRGQQTKVELYRIYNYD